MNTFTNDTFQPNWFSIPGDTINDLLIEKNLSLEAFADTIGKPASFVKCLISGKEEITSAIALQLSKALGASADFWLRREFQYREDLIRLQQVDEAAWLKLLPIRDMIKFGWLKSEASKNVQALLQYFGVQSINEWHFKYQAEMAQVSFRTSTKQKQQPGAVAAWLRQGEVQTETLACKDWNPKLFRQSLVEIKKLTRVKDPGEFLPKLIAICADCGVALAIERTPEGCPASGVTKFLSSNRALIMLSFRYLTDDQFWFTFFHEAGHLLLHGKNCVFVEEMGKDRLISEEGKEANDFAGEQLVPEEMKPRLMAVSAYNKKAVIGFAASMGVSPGIIIGQLQHAGKIPQNKFNSYKRHYTWDTILPHINH